MNEGPNRSPFSCWHPPPETLTLPPDEVHVWRAALDVGSASLERFQQTLSQGERDRAGRFYFQSHRDRFVAAHGFLRSILGRYLGVAPRDLEFVSGQYGKPALAHHWAAQGIRFNLSHSEGLALYAVARGREVGIDVERRRPEFPARDVAEKFFSPREVDVLFALPLDLQPQAFFNCWTRKEAYIKATGLGLSLALDRFDVVLVPGEPVALLGTRPDPEERSRWRLQELDAGGAYAAAVAVAGSSWDLRCWQIPDDFPGIGEESPL